MFIFSPSKYSGLYIPSTISAIVVVYTKLIIWRFCSGEILIYCWTLFRYAFPWWREKEILSEERRSQGLCPLTPEEAALTLQALGFNKETQLYIAAGEIYGSERRLATLREAFPMTVSTISISCAQIITFWCDFIWNMSVKAIGWNSDDLWCHLHEFTPSGALLWKISVKRIGWNLARLSGKSLHFFSHQASFFISTKKQVKL